MLKRRGHTVTGIDRVKDDDVELDHFMYGDLLDDGLIDAAVDSQAGGVDMVMHLAAAKGDWGISANEFHRDNVETTTVLLEKGRQAGIKSWIFYSSVAALGPSDIALPEEAAFSPAIPYGASKAEGEKLFHTFAEEDADAQITIIRPSVVYGAGNPSSTNIYRLIEAIYHNRFVMIGDGDTIKTTSYIENLLAANLFLMDRMSPGVQTYHYVDAPAKTTADLIRVIYRLLEKKQPAWHLPRSMAAALAMPLDALSTLTGKDLPITAARINKFCTATNFDASAIRKLGFEQPVGFEESLRRTVDWHMNEVVAVAV